MTHCAETRKRLNDTAAVEQATRAGLPVGHWPAHVEAVTLDDDGRIVWPHQVRADHYRQWSALQDQQQGD